MAQGKRQRVNRLLRQRRRTGFILGEHEPFTWSENVDTGGKEAKRGRKPSELFRGRP